jgi:hypothetical protein
MAYENSMGPNPQYSRRPLLTPFKLSFIVHDIPSGCQGQSRDSSVVEQLIRNHQVKGSTPFPGSNKKAS